jgi:ABC-2 type transport system permease protein
VLVAPIPRSAMVLGKVLGGALIALAQAVLFLLLGLTLGITLSAVSLAATVAFMLLVAVALTALGLVDGSLEHGEGHDLRKNLILADIVEDRRL